MNRVMSGLVMAISLCACAPKVANNTLDVDRELNYCNEQIQKTLTHIGDITMMPRNILEGQTHWNLVPVKIEEWTVGFWPGILWYNYENTKSKEMMDDARHYTDILEPLTMLPAYDHDLGFQLFCSYGNGYRLTGDEKYKQIILNAADTLATLFNPKVGTILSWPREVDNGRFAPFNTIMDNMINLEMLYWAAANGGTKELYDIATRHAETTMKYHFREDGSNYHVTLYDTITGDFIKGVTHQGYADETMWARGQAWAIYGYTMVYRETGDKKFLRFAEKVTDIYLKRLPKDYVPYWDFDVPNIPDEPKDASAAAIVASALLELSQLEDNPAKAVEYKYAAVNMLISLSSDEYRSGETNSAFLLRSTGHKPNGSEIDASINYADYYYIEALTRLKKMEG
ncbi:MAG: glycoside hydrolase family 88 protein [Proteiniphilum sp.]|uniref:glycoside hydrolase family 88 protein n=1 Tax=Proteiniphilum sp. TaxID=1926877 RepID=UPI002B208326|nr:glycoside hydrolase family 88 protein [Proteiniphilum sp.]MEA5129540.1 glycoside hydrolase family 88 protein [Proteiniphilum sp.]